MSSVFFRIEAYNCSYGCPEYGLMGYTKIENLVQDCWDHYHTEHAEDFEDDTDVLTDESGSKNG